MAQQDSTGSSTRTIEPNFDELVQREEQKERIEKLKERVCELEMEKGSLQLRLMEMEGTNGSKPPLIDIELERDSLRAERDCLKVKCDELLAKLDSIELQRDKVFNDKEKIGNELKKLKELNNNLNKDKDKYKSDIEQLNQTISKSIQKFNSVNSELNTIKSEIVDKDSEVQAVRKQLSDLALKSKTIISEKDSIINQLNQQLSEQNSNEIVLEKEKLIENLNEKFENQFQQNSSVNQINDELKAQNSELETQLKNIIIEYEKQKSNFDQIIVEKSNFEKENHLLIERLENDIQVLRKENIELKKLLESSDSQTHDLQQKTSDYSELYLQLEELKKINSDLKLNSEQKSLDLENTIKNLNQEITVLFNDKTLMSEELNYLKTSLEAEQRQKLEALELLEQLKNENFNEKELIAEKDRQIDCLRNELQKFESILSENRFEIDVCKREQVCYVMYL